MMVTEAENLSQVDSNMENDGQDTGDTEQLNQQTSDNDAEIQAGFKKPEEARNFVRLREARERAERERDEAIRRLQQIEQEKQKQEEPEPNPFDFGNDDDLAEIKHLKMLAERQKQLEDQIKQYQQQTVQQTAEARLKSQYSDIDKVVTDDNIRRLQQEDPDLAASLSHNPDPYSKYSAAYKAIKRMGIYQEDNYQAERQRVAENTTKPRPLASVSPQQGKSPLARANAFANGLTPELRQQLIKEMQEARKKY